MGMALSRWFIPKKRGSGNKKTWLQKKYPYIKRWLSGVQVLERV